MAVVAGSQGPLGEQGGQWCLGPAGGCPALGASRRQESKPWKHGPDLPGLGQRLRTPWLHRLVLRTARRLLSCSQPWKPRLGDPERQAQPEDLGGLSSLCLAAALTNPAPSRPQDPRVLPRECLHGARG